MWTTTHQTAERKMIHDFGNGFQIIVDFHLKFAYKMRNNERYDKFSIENMSIEDYTQILSNFAKAVSE